MQMYGDPQGKYAERCIGVSMRSCFGDAVCGPAAMLGEMLAATIARHIGKENEAKQR